MKLGCSARNRLRVLSEELRDLEICQNLIGRWFSMVMEVLATAGPGLFWLFGVNAALDQLRAQGFPVLDDDVARLSPFVRHHLNVHGKYSFLLPELRDGLRVLGDPDAPDPESD